jgi:hypothetical protein
MKFYRTKKLGPKLVFSTKFGGKLSFIPSFLFPERLTIATYIFTAPTCTTTIITLKPCALNAEFKHFILKFNKISLLCRYHWKRGKGLKDSVTTLSRTLLTYKISQLVKYSLWNGVVTCVINFMLIGVTNMYLV